MSFSRAWSHYATALVMAFAALVVDAVHACASPQFTLLEGERHDVCKDYVIGLNRINFTTNEDINSRAYLPQCGRSEALQPQTIGQPLRTTLDPAIAAELEPDVRRFRATGSVNARVRHDKMLADLGVPAGESISQRVEFMKARDPSQMPFIVNADIDNDGSQDRILMWQRPTLCGRKYERILDLGEVIPIVLVEGSLAFDAARTQGIFAARPADTAIKRSYRPVGKSVGIFTHGTKTYFDTFVDDDPAGQPGSSRSPGLIGVLHVFMHEVGASRRICRIGWVAPENVSRTTTDSAPPHFDCHKAGVS